MTNFNLHLEKIGFVPKSISRASGCVKRYINWLKERNLNIEETTYNDVLNYVGYMQKEGKKKGIINENLRNIRLYYDYLQIPNVAYEVRLRGEEKQSLPLFTTEELDKIYQVFKPKETGKYRFTDKLFLGLVVYQALDEKDLFRIELNDLNLETGKIYIPAGVKRKASRTLKLESHQIIPLHEYIQNHRDNSTDKLFSPQCEKFNRLHDQFKNLSKRVREQAKEEGINLIRFNQIRHSRITLWIKSHGLRKTQYMGGFKRVDNVERYRQQDTEDLSEYVNKYHPLQ